MVAQKQASFTSHCPRKPEKNIQHQDYHQQCPRTQIWGEDSSQSHREVLRKSSVQTIRESDIYISNASPWNLLSTKYVKTSSSNHSFSTVKVRSRLTNSIQVGFPDRRHISASTQENHWKCLKEDISLRTARDKWGRWDYYLQPWKVYSVSQPKEMSNQSGCSAAPHYRFVPQVFRAQTPIWPFPIILFEAIPFQTGGTLIV